MTIYTDSYLLSNLSSLLTEAKSGEDDELLFSLLHLKKLLSSRDIKRIYILDKGKIAYPEEVRDFLRNQKKNEASPIPTINYRKINYSTSFTYFIFSTSPDPILNKNNKYSISIKDIKFTNTELFGDISKNPKTDIKTWSNFNRFYPILPTNSIIVCDNFLFKNNKLNIEGLLKTILLNSNTENEIDITLICGEDNLMEDLQESWDMISLYLMNDLNFKKNNLSIIKKANREYHDRHIFTDYQVFDSGNSYSMYFKASTTLHGIPYTKDNQDFKTKFSHYIKHLKEIKFILRSVKDSEFIGNLNNKIIDSI